MAFDLWSKGHQESVPIPVSPPVQQFNVHSLELWNQEDKSYGWAVSITNCQLSDGQL